MEESIKDVSKRILVVDEHYRGFYHQKRGIEERFQCSVEVTDGVLEARAWLEGGTIYHLGIVDPSGFQVGSVLALLDDLKKKHVPVILLSPFEQDFLQKTLGVVQGEDYAGYRHKPVEKLSLYGLIDKLLPSS